jgi:methionine-gamma-lyase
MLLVFRHSSPSNLYLDKTLAAMEGTGVGKCSASGMGLKLHLLFAVVRN